MSTIVQQTTINNRNIFTAFRCLLKKGAFAAFQGAIEYKKTVSNESRNESGTRYSAVQAALRHKSEREFTITLVTTDATKAACLDNFDALCKEAEDGIAEWSVPRLGYKYYFILTKRATAEFYTNGALVTAMQQITLVEPNPDNRVKL